MSRKENRIRRKPISILNWMLTIIVTFIPGVNVLGCLGMLIFSKNRSKKNYSAAALILIAIFVVLFLLAFLFFGDQIVDLTKKLSESVK